MYRPRWRRGVVALVLVVQTTAVINASADEPDDGDGSIVEQPDPGETPDDVPVDPPTTDEPGDGTGADDPDVVETPDPGPAPDETDAEDDQEEAEEDAPDEAEDDESIAEVQAGTLTVTPSTSLVDGQTVTLKGSGWGAFTLLGAAQCHDGGSIDGCELSDLRSFSADNRGRFNETYRVETIVNSADGVHDCRVVGCVIGVNSDYTPTGAAIVPIGFDPAGPLLPPPTLTVTPDTGLVDGQTVAVTGTGFNPGEYVFLQQCGLPASYESCSFASQAVLHADAAGDVSGSFFMEAVFATFGATSIGQVDCRVVACALVSGDVSGGDDTVVVPLGFDLAAPLRPPPTLVADPATGLRDADVIEVSGDGYRPNQYTQVLQCRPGSTGFGGCLYSGQATVDANGHLTGHLVARTVLPGGFDGSYDCRDGGCTAVAVDGPFFFDIIRAGTAALDFDPDAPARLSPEVQLDPADDLVDGQWVSVSGQGFRPYSTLGLIQCVVDAGSQAGCDSSTLTYGSASGPESPPGIFFGLTGGTSAAHDPRYGDISTSFRVKRVITLGDGTTVDCARTACMLGIGDIDQLDTPTSTPLSFREMSAADVVTVGPVSASPTFAG